MVHISLPQYPSGVWQLSSRDPENKKRIKTVKRVMLVSAVRLLKEVSLWTLIMSSVNIHGK